MSSELSSAFKQALKRPGFAVVLLVLLIGAIGINAATTGLNLFFRKEALSLRHADGLKALPTRLGTWMAVPSAQTLDADMEHSLGTDKYVFRDYVDLSATTGGTAFVATENDIKAMDNMSEKEINDKLNAIRAKGNPNAILRLALTYYTGKVDTVPHVPERCMVADGFQPAKWDVYEWQLGKYPSGEPRHPKVRFIDFEDQTLRGQQNRCVTYFFNANGVYLDDPNAVRRRLQDLRTKYACFAKVEVLTLLPPRLATALDVDAQRETDRNAAAEAVKRFLTAAMPEVEKLLPDPAVFGGR